VAATLARNHIFIAPSITDSSGLMEGIPNSLKEAMAVGVPSVATRHAGIPELVEEEKTGWLVPEADVDSLVSKIRHVIENRDRWFEVAQAARLEIQRNYNAESQIDEMVSIYENVLHQGKAKSG